MLTHIDHAGAKLNAAGLRGDSRQKRVRGGLLLIEMVHTEERAVQADVFGTYRQIDSLVQRFGCAVHARTGNFGPVPKRKKTKFFLCARLWFKILYRKFGFLSV